MSHITLSGPLLSYQSFACMLWFSVLCFDGLFVCFDVCLHVCCAFSFFNFNFLKRKGVELDGGEGLEGDEGEEL